MPIIGIACFFLAFVCVGSNSARKSYEQINEMYPKVNNIEDMLKSEERMISVLNMGIVSSTVDRLSKKVDHIVNILENGLNSEGNARIGGTGVVSSDMVSNLQGIDSRLRSLETGLEKVEQGMEKTDDAFQKLDDMDRRTTHMKDDLNQKLRKMMNVITTLYEMNKEMKTNMGGRSGGGDDSDSNRRGESGQSYATDFLIENLEELERKIKEQFSVLGNEIRSEITSLKIMASSVGSKCETKDSSEYEWEETPKQGRSASRQDLPSVPRSRVENTLDELVQSLGRSTREIREEIHQGIQDIDVKLTNISMMAQVHACEGLDASESVVSSRKAAAPREQDVEVKSSDAQSEHCSKVARGVSSPKSCAELRQGGATCDGVYVIFPMNVRAVRVLCDMTTDGGGWTVFMRRGDFDDKMFSFHKNWASYKNGFGDVEGEFWLGNDVIHLLTTQDQNTLRVSMEAFDDDVLNLTYSSFTVGDESKNYILQLGLAMGKPSAASNSLRYHSNHPFSTFDKKNDQFEQNCAATYKGGWWFNGCYFGFLTGEYFRPGDKRENWQGILWYDWKGSSSLKGAQMKIRPKNFSV